jgi:tetratricopeptide (TPR) repeat protein
MTRRTPRLLRDALPVALATLALLACLELGARALDFGAPTPIALPPKTPGSFRILAFGESTVLGVPEGAYAFTTFLAHELHRMAPDRDVELLNLARSGIGSADVREAFAQGLEGSPDLAIVLMGHNEFLVAEQRRGWRGALLRLRERSRLVTALARALGRDAAAVEPPLPDAIPPVWPESPFAREVLEEFGRNLDAIVAMARERGIPLILATAPSNLAEWPPAFLRVELPDSADHAAVVANTRALLAEGKSAQALDELQVAKARFGDDAMLLYLEAQALRAQGRPSDARALYQQALDRDLVPRRASSATNERVRAAATQDGVVLVDVAALFAKQARDGLVGFELICDNCHPTPFGHALIGRAIATAMQQRGLLVPPDAQIGSQRDWMARMQERNGDAEARLNMRARWLLSNAIYAMKTPFFNFEASRRYLEEVRQLAPDDWRVWANLATLALLDGDLSAGRRDLLRATRLRGAPLDPSERGSVPYLAEALALTGTSLPPALTGTSLPRPSEGGS